MNKSIRRTVLTIALLWTTALPAAEQWHTSTLKYVYPYANGDFVLIFDGDAPNCPASGPGKYMAVTVGQNGMTSEGAKKIYSLALAAMITRNPLSIAFDDLTIYCYLNRVSMNP